MTLDRTQFDERYPDVDLKTIVLSNGDEIMKVGREELCWDCSRRTRWVSTSFHAYLCSDECVRNKWNEYWEATRK